MRHPPRHSILHSAFTILHLIHSPGVFPPACGGEKHYQTTERIEMAYKKFTASEEMLKPDPRFNSKLLSKFVNCIMWDGKKSVAQRIVYDALEKVSAKVSDASPIEVFENAINNVKPFVEVRSKRVGGANYQVPMQVNKRRQQSLAFRWIINACREQGGRPMHNRLADELMGAYNKQGKAMDKREQTHRMADANKAFAHFAW